MSESLISIIIPVLNGSKFLVRCFDTLEKQLYSNLEVIFIDNGSEDDSKEIIKNQCSIKKNYYLIECNIPGPGAARNFGIKFSKGEYISFLDVDDELKPDKHHILIEGFKSYPKAAMVVGNTSKIYSDGREVMLNLGPLNVGLNEPPKAGFLWLQQFQHHPHINSMLIKKQSILHVNGIPENMFMGCVNGEDIALSVKIGMENEIILIDKLVCIYHRHNESAVTKANQVLSVTERFFQFHEKFALPYFYEKKHMEPFKRAYYLCDNIAYKMLMKLIKDEKRSSYIKILKDLQSNLFISRSFLRKLFFSIFPYNIANYLHQKFYRYSQL